MTCHRGAGNPAYSYLASTDDNSSHIVVTPPRQHTERPAAVMLRGVLCVSKIGGLLAEAKGLDDGTVALDVLVLKVVEEDAALTYKCYEGTFGSMIFTVGLHVFRQMGNTV